MTPFLCSCPIPATFDQGSENVYLAFQFISGMLKHI